MKNNRLLFKVAQAYYIDGLTQNEIAKQFGVSRPKVSRLLKEARTDKIVTITLIPPTEGTSELEKRIEEQYGVEEAIVIPVSNNKSQSDVARDLGPAAAECITRRLSGKKTISLSWGSSIMGFVDALQLVPFPELTVVQMNGGLGPSENFEHSAELTSRFDGKLSAKRRLLQSPGIVSSKEVAKSFMKEKQITNTLDLAIKSDIAIIGIGVPTTDSLLIKDGSILSEKEIKTIKESDAMGDIALRYFNKDGKLVDLEINERIIGLTLEEIKKIPTVIAIAGGSIKSDAIKVALNMGLINVIVTDSKTAKKLVNN